MALNGGYTYVLELPPGAVGGSLADYLAERYPHSTRSEWSDRIADGSVRVDGREVTWRRPPWAEPEAPTCFAVLHRDPDLLAVAKPAGLPTLPGAGYLERTLLSLVRALDPEADPLHRLGRFTSGVVLFARTSQARRHLSRAFASRQVVKRYRALASGTPERDVFTIEVPIGPVPHATLGTVHGASSKGRASHSEVTVLERRQGTFLCDVHITTGRPHQIRIHLAAAGHPLAGDPLYAPGGLPLPGCRAVPGDPGYLLHAAEVRIAGLVLSCAPPRELRTP